ncbi:MAG: glycosyltransferase family 29 protein [Planctomycetia bacterium]|nr:glycosyltransferase family 29 protein [Planctomycetia bacterium]
MHLIDPFQFRDMFADARSFAVVGNAPTILEYENGKKIDSHDVVVRFNRATTTGLESKIGSRTDILVVNASNSRAMAPPPSATLKPRCLLSYVSPQGVPSVPREPFSDWVGELPILLTFGPDLIDLPGEHHTRPMTSGTYFLLTILRMLTVERLFVTGFTMFGAKGGATAKYYKDDRPGVGSFHDLDVESRIFANLLAQSDARLDMTPEVLQVVGVADSGKCANGARLPLRRRIAGGLAWRLLNFGTKLRRFAESR